MKKLTLSILLVSGALVASMNQNMHTFSEFDTNKDGKVTKSEFETTQQNNMIKKAEAGYPMKNAGNAPTFSAVDTNKDGFINAQEFNTQQQKNMQNRSRQSQSNGMKRGNMKNKQGMGKNW